SRAAGSDLWSALSDLRGSPRPKRLFRRRSHRARTSYVRTPSALRGGLNKIFVGREIFGDLLVEPALAAIEQKRARGIFAEGDRLATELHGRKRLGSHNDVV